MAKGSDILLTVNPKGNFLEGYVTGTPKPGTCMEIDWSESAVQGRFYWEPYGTTTADGERGVGGDGHRRLVAVLLPVAGFITRAGLSSFLVQLEQIPFRVDLGT